MQTVQPLAASTTPETARETRVWNAAAASVRGASHQKIGSPCQDANAWEIVGNDCFVGAVADGAGSAARGEEGARIAADRAVSFLRERLASGITGEVSDSGIEQILKECMAAARESIYAKAGEEQSSRREFATTLIIVIGCAEFVAAAQIGDGASVASEAAAGSIF